MSDAHSKSMVFLIAPVLVILAGALYLVAKPLSPTPAPVVPSAGPAATTTPNPVLAGATASTQAKITWSPTSTEVILSPGESTSKGITFTSSLNLQNVVIEAVPEIAGFLTVQPNSFASVPAGQPQSVHASFLIPAGTKLGTYDGTIHLRVGSTTFPQTVKIVVNVWRPYSGLIPGLSFKFPPQWSISEQDSPDPNDPTPVIAAVISPHGSDFLILPRGGEGYELNDALDERMSAITVSGFSGKRRDFRLTDGTLVLTRIELDGVPNSPEYRVEFRVDDPLDLPLLERMLQTLVIFP